MFKDKREIQKSDLPSCAVNAETEKTAKHVPRCQITERRNGLLRLQHNRGLCALEMDRRKNCQKDSSHYISFHDANVKENNSPDHFLIFKIFEKIYRKIIFIFNARV